MTIVGSKAWHEANKERENARSRAWYAANKKRAAAYRKAYREKNKEATVAYQKSYCEANKEAKAAYDKTYRETHRERLCANMRLQAIKRLYGLSADQFASMIQSQNGRCACCRTPFGLLKATRPCVDHCHHTGQIRGILCRLCNTLIGHASDSPKALRRAARYLERNTTRLEQEDD